MSYYRRIKDLREDADMTQKEVAAHLGTTTQYYGKYEKGERELPFYRAIELADFYKINLDYIAERTDSKTIMTKTEISEEELNVIRQYRKLTEKNKGKIELQLEQYLKKQNITPKGEKI